MLKRRLLGIIKLKGEKMSKKKSKLFLSITALMFCLGIMCFGVYAATSVSYTLSGHITYDVSDVFVDIKTRHYLSTQTDLSLAKGDVASVMGNIATNLESGTTSIDGVTELTSDYDEQSTLNNVGGEKLPLTGPALNITYGAYSNTLGQEKAYVHYIAILVTNYAEEEINGILDLNSLYDLQDSNSQIFTYQTMNNIAAKSGETNGAKCFVFALGLDQPAQSADVDFSGVTLSVTRGNLDQYATEGLSFEYSETDGGYLVSDYTGTDTRVIVPSKYDDKGEHGEKNVVGIKEGTYPGHAISVFTNKSFKEMYLPDTIKNIGKYSFSQCSSLVNINIPEAITVIEEYTFDRCSSLTSITISKNNSLVYIHEAFNECSNLESINLIDCTKLTTLGKYRGGGATSVFRGSKISIIAIPASVNEIQIGVFSGCNELKSIVVDENNQVYDSRDNCNAIIESTTNTLISGCKNTIIPRGVTTIGEYAFNECYSLASIIIPSDVINIEQFAFISCDSLSSATFEDSDSVWSVGSGNTTITVSEYSASELATYLTKAFYETPSGYSADTWAKN